MFFLFHICIVQSFSVEFIEIFEIILRYLDDVVKNSSKFIYVLIFSLTRANSMGIAV